VTRPPRPTEDVIPSFDPLSRLTAAFIEIDYPFHWTAEVCDDATIWREIRPRATPPLRSLTTKHFNSGPDRRNPDSKQSVFWRAIRRIAPIDVLFPTEPHYCMEPSCKADAFRC